MAVLVSENLGLEEGWGSRYLAALEWDIPLLVTALGGLPRPAGHLWGVPSEGSRGSNDT